MSISDLFNPTQRLQKKYAEQLIQQLPLARWAHAAAIPFEREFISVRGLDLAAKTNSRLVIIGAPGAGKSTALASLALAHARALASNQPHAIVPIYFSAREQNPQSLPRLRDLPAALGLGNVPPDFLLNAISENRALILVDDLDALPSDAAKEWLKEFSGAHLVATSQSAVLDLAEFSLPAWRDQDVERFARQKFGKRTEAFLGALKASGVPRTLTASPMTLALLAHAWESERPAAPAPSELHTALDIKPLPVKRAPLFDTYANEILANDDETARMLEGVALAIQRGKPATNEFVAKSKGFLRAGTLAPPATTVSEAKRSGRAGENSTCDFIHDLWRAYFAARAARHAPDLSAIADHLQDPAWCDVILFYAGLGDASDLIQTLIQHGDWLLAGSAIANAADARADLRDTVTKELLERAWKGETRAAVVLGEMQSDMAVAALAVRLKDPDPAVRSRAAEILGRLQIDRALEYLLPQMRDVNADTRDQVVAALGQSLSNRVIEPLLGAFRGDFRVGVVDTRMRVAAAKALGQVGSDKAVPALIVDLQIAEPEVRFVVAEALKRIDSPLMIKPLKGILPSVDEETRKYVTDVLAAVNGKEN